jgi:hypothetical protein
MDKKELREEIAKELFWTDWDDESGYAYANASNGYWENQDELLHGHYLKRADQILALADAYYEEKYKGYVKLAKD